MAVLRRRGGRRDVPNGAGGGARAGAGAGDDVDLEAVAGVIVEAAAMALGARPELTEGPEPIPAGAGAGPDAYLFAVATDDPAWSGTLVARTSPVEVLRREASCIRALGNAGYPVPAMVADRHEDGVVIVRPPGGTTLAASMVEDMLAVPRLLAGFGRLHARLHDLRLDELGPDLALGDGTAPLDELDDRADTDAVRDEVDAELTWLAKYRRQGTDETGTGETDKTGESSGDGAVLCHGELNPVHVYVTDADPDTAVPVNWTRARRAEPAFDVAATVTAFWTSPLYVEGTVQRTAMKMIRDSLISAYLKAYAEASADGLDDDAVRYWQAFHLAWLATDLARRVHDEPVAAWEAAASVPNAAGALDDVRKRFWDLADG